MKTLLLVLNIFSSGLSPGPSLVRAVAYRALRGVLEPSAAPEGGAEVGAERGGEAHPRAAADAALAGSAAERLI